MASPLSSVIQFMDSSWNPILQPYISNTPSFDKLKKFLEEEYKTNTIFPPCEQVWSWSIVPFEDIKVVILGQDPYHGPGQANGKILRASHSVWPMVLRNIYKELARDVPRFEIPSHGNLKGWVKQVEAPCAQILTSISTLLLPRFSGMWPLQPLQRLLRPDWISND
ncbi:hypothetical protein B566_EDAN001503 [Ephemera danica]|nr:hypothetical protein B566_EDAN001503 [Ephemera danica]